MFLCVAAAVVGASGCTLYEPPLYRITILPTISGRSIEAYSLNDVGQVVGVVETDDGKPRLFLWDRQSGMQDLGPVEPDALIIDNGGRICGTMPDPNGPRAFVWQAGKGRTILDLLGGVHNVALAMNNCGQIVGLSFNANGIPRALVWDGARGTRELVAPDGGRYWPQSINDAGQILATSIHVPAKFWPWFLIDSNGMTLLDGVPPSLDLRSMNRSSCMAGVDKLTGSSHRLVLWQRQASPQCVASLSLDASLTRLNDRGQIAYTDFRDGTGAADEAVSHLWDPVRGRVPLEKYVHGMRFVVADLNNNGSIVGTAEMADGTTRAVLLNPISERWRK